MDPLHGPAFLDWVKGFGSSVLDPLVASMSSTLFLSRLNYRLHVHFFKLSKTRAGFKPGTHA